MNLKTKRIRLFLSPFLLVAVFSSVSAQERRLLPVDQGGRDASFSLFRRNLIRAVERRDAKFVLSVVDRNIKNGFGGNDGIEEFKKAWKINAPKSALWNELMFVLVSGGTFDKTAKNKTFWSPYIYTNFPEALDAFEHGVIIADGVKLFAKPAARAASVANLSYNIVKIDYEKSVKDKSNPGRFTWVKIETLGGKSGFVPSRFLRSPTDYRAAFEKKPGGWKMIFFAAGD